MVEDNAVASLQIRSALEENGYAVHAAGGGEEALAFVRKTVPDAIVLDLMMPGVDGFQVLEKVRSTSETATLPVLVLTAKEITAEDRDRLSYNNIQQLIQKGSVDRNQLVACIGRLLETQESHNRSELSGPASEKAGSLPSAADERNGAVLIVEDNPDNRLTLEAILNDMSCRCIAVKDGAQAVKAAKEIRPGLILMDMQLPILNGLDATRQIKADPSLGHIPIVALTARAMKGDRESFLAAGCDDYLSKPLDPDAVKKIVKKWVEAPGNG